MGGTGPQEDLSKVLEAPRSITPELLRGPCRGHRAGGPQPLLIPHQAVPPTLPKQLIKEAMSVMNEA